VGLRVIQQVAKLSHTTITNMKSKQLANVLIKILGLSVVIHSIPTIITGLFNMMRVRGIGMPGESWLYPVSSVVLLALGIFLILQSRCVTDLLFKNDDE
jgi:Mg2+ and Co2+ transporter CorA